MKSVSLNTLREIKTRGEKFTCLTAYDACFARVLSSSGVEVLLVGDSLGMVLQGKDSTLPVSVADLAYHTQCVSQGNQGSLIMADMPFMSYGDTASALANAATLMRAGAHLVKLEGGQWLSQTVTELRRNGVPSCIHMGLTPQSVNVFGGYKIQGREEDAATRMLQEAIEVEAAGASILLLECVPSALAAQITEALSIPVIGIGAGRHTDGQVLVMHDMLGLHAGKPPRFVKNFLAESKNGVQGATQLFIDSVKGGQFPGPEHEFH